jgi:hypothetical protein
MQQNNDDADANLRSKILPGLQKIRFDSVTQQELVQLFQEELGNVLTGDEKSSMLMSIISGNWELMPKDVVPSIKLAPRHEPYTFFSLPYAADQNKNQLKSGNNFGDKRFTFKVDKSTDIVGIKLNLTAPYHKLITFTLYHFEEYENVATGSVNITSPLHRGEVLCPFKTIQTLVANEWYFVEFQFDGFDESSFHCGYVLPRDKDMSVCDGLTLTVQDSSTLCVHILGIVFSKVADTSI